MYASVDGLSNNAQLLLSSGAQTDLQNKVEQYIHYYLSLPFTGYKQNATDKRKYKRLIVFLSIHPEALTTY